MESEIKLLSKAEAIGLLNGGEYIHTFSQAGQVLIGADHSRESILEDIENAEQLEIGGETCRNMKHALVINRKLFVEVNMDKVNEIDPISENN